MMRCPLCGEAYSDEYRYCEHDAALLVEASVAARDHEVRFGHGPVAGSSYWGNGLIVSLIGMLAGTVLLGVFAMTVIGRQDAEQTRLRQEQVAQDQASTQALAIKAQQAAEEAEAARVKAESAAQEAEQRAKLAEEELARQRTAAATAVPLQLSQNGQYATSAPIVPTPTELTEEVVSSFVSRWLAAQNSRDFALYRRLYAEDFQGVKRTTRRTKTYGRAGWLADRRGMFEKTRSMDVSVSNQRVTLRGNWAEVSFDQYFRSTTYNDWGPKVLRVRNTVSGTQIFHEELIASNPL